MCLLIFVDKNKYVYNSVNADWLTSGFKWPAIIIILIINMYII